MCIYIFFDSTLIVDSIFGVKNKSKTVTYKNKLKKHCRKSDLRQAKRVTESIQRQWVKREEI